MAEACEALQETRLVSRPPVKCTPFTVGEVAILARTTQCTVRRWIARGELKAQRAGRRWLVAADALEEFLQ